MTRITLDDLAKELIMHGVKQFRQEWGYRGQASFAPDTVVLPERTLATLLARGYSAIRIKLRPAPEAYVLEANMRVKCEKARDCWRAGKDPERCTDCFAGCGESFLKASKEPLELPDGLAKYLQEASGNKRDTLLNRFKRKDIHIEVFEFGGIKYHVFGTITFNFKDKTREIKKDTLSGFSGIRQKHSGFLYLHTHPGGMMWPSCEDFTHGMVRPLQGIVNVNHIAFTKFVMEHKPDERDLVLLTYKRRKGTERGYFIPAGRMHELAREYAKNIIRGLGRYLKDRGMPIIAWETCDDGNIRFFENYEIA